MKNKIILVIIGIVIVVGGVYAWSYSAKNNASNTSKIKNELGGDNIITVFKSLTCSCCAEYISYLKKEGFEVKVENTDNMLAIKEKYNVPSDAESCHTSVIGNYVVEGHVPFVAIKKLLTEKPTLDGIALPGMIPGSPGMSGPARTDLKVVGISKGQITDFIAF